MVTANGTTNGTNGHAKIRYVSFAILRHPITDKLSAAGKYNQSRRKNSY
jgi:hypothetical protein